MKKLFFPPIFLFCFTAFFVLATACNYSMNGDSECNPSDQNYCMMWSCQKYSGEISTFCTDSDANNAWTTGTISYRYRSYDGSIMQGTMNDDCMEANQIKNCSSVGCSSFEWVCEQVGSTPYTSNAIPCPGACNNGHCIDAIAPNSIVLTNGTFNSINFPSQITGTASDNESGLQKVEVSIKRDSDIQYWNGNSWNAVQSWQTASGTGNWNYSFSAANLSAGVYSLYSKATDNAGNSQNPPSYQYFLFTTTAGQSCNFQTNGDTECTPASNIYCIGNNCTQLSTPPAIASCNDTDDQNFYNSGTVTYNYRNTTDGTVLDGTATDWCGFGTSPTSSCNTGTDCNVHESYCKTVSSGQNYDYNSKKCDSGCNNGACNQNNQTTEIPCNFASFHDVQCNSDNNIFCISYHCTKTSGLPAEKCIDSDGMDNNTNGTVRYTYRGYDGGVMDGNISDNCIQGNTQVTACTDLNNCKVREVFCKNGQYTGANYDFNIFDCNHGCSNGACTTITDQNLPTTVNNSQLLHYIEQWAKKLLNATEALNNSIIEKIIQIWKNN